MELFIFSIDKTQLTSIVRRDLFRGIPARGGNIPGLGQKVITTEM